MYCSLYIKTKENLEHYRQDLVDHFGGSNTEEIKKETTSNKGSQKYFCGSTNEKVNFLFAESNADGFIIFVEGKRSRGNFDQLITGVEIVFDDVKSLLDKHKVKCIKISASIWSEEEQMLTGVYQDYWVKIKSFIPDIPSGIILTFLTIIYSVVQPKIEGTDITTENAIKSAGINFLILLLAILIWLMLKASSKGKKLEFKNKK
jgi:hypothetical protein